MATEDVATEDLSYSPVVDVRDNVVSLGRTRFGAPVFDFIAKANEVIAVAALGADLAITFANTVIRLVSKNDIFWAQDFETICLNIIAFLGGAAYIRRSTGMAFTLVVDQAPPRLRSTLRAVGYWEVVLVCLATLYAFPEFFQSMASQQLPALGLTQGWNAIWIGLAFALILMYTLEKLMPLGVAANVVALGITAAEILALLALKTGVVGPDVVNPFFVMLFALLVSFISGVPIAFLLAATSLAFIFATDMFPLSLGPTSYQGVISGSPLLIAIPFFMAAGVLMEVTGMANRLVDMIRAWVDQWRGGLLQAAILAVYVFSGISGSKSADIAAVGSSLRGPMKERGYPSTEFVAVLAAGAAMGEALPPSIALLVLASITTLSVASLFLAGVVPCAVVAVALMIAVYLRSRGGRLPRGRSFSLRRAISTMPLALPALLVPLIIVGGIVGGISTPTEASSFAVVYGLLAAVVLYRSLSLDRLWVLLRDSTLLAGIILFMVSTANLLTKVLVASGMSTLLTNVLTLSNSRIWFLVASSLSVVVLGFVLEGLPAILISGPLLIPLAVQLGIDPLQYGVVLVIATGIGVFAPPLGIGYYTACAIGGAPVHSTMRPSLFYNIFLLVGLMLVVAVPAITLTLPHALGLH